MEVVVIKKITKMTVNEYKKLLSKWIDEEEVNTIFEDVPNIEYIYEEMELDKDGEEIAPSGHIGMSFTDTDTYAVTCIEHGFNLSWREKTFENKTKLQNEWDMIDYLLTHN